MGNSWENIGISCQGMGNSWDSMGNYGDFWEITDDLWILSGLFLWIIIGDGLVNSLIFEWLWWPLINKLEFMNSYSWVIFVWIRIDHQNLGWNMRINKWKKSMCGMIYVMTMGLLMIYGWFMRTSCIKPTHKSQLQSPSQMPRSIDSAQMVLSLCFITKDILEIKKRNKSTNQNCECNWL